MCKKLLFSLVILAVAKATFAQTLNHNDEDDDPYEKITYFMFGLNYLSNNVYLGRHDSTVIPYYSPYIGYHFKNGFYAKGMASFTPVNGTHLDLATLEVGYDHSFGDHFNGGVNAERFYYNKNSTSVRANTKGDIGCYGQLTNVWLEP